LQLSDLAALAMDPDTHALDLAPDEFDGRHWLRLQNCGVGHKNK
jgi:hypothetical protein